MEFTIKQIAEMLGGVVKGDNGLKINMLSKIQEAKAGQIAFLSNPKYEHFIYETKASAVIVKKDFVPKKEVTSSLIMVDDPYSSFTVLLEEYHKMISFQKEGVEEPSFIGDNCTVGKSNYRGAFSYIGHNVKIGDNVKIYPHTYIGDNVSIGSNTILHANVKLYAGTVVGNNCIIHSGTVLGSDGFGFAPQEDGTYKTIPQLGNVVLEDNITIGANTVIDCATLSGDSTVIRSGVKLDNLIQIAHNVEIGKNTVIAAQTGISGSTKVGENCVLAGQVGIAGHLVIANKTSVGAQAGISKSVKEEGQRLLGYPVLDIKEYFRSYAVFKQLPDLSTRLKQLEQKLAALSAVKSD
ncbi:MAG: UDP-3-O-(3-hydroxymyristoyl)glucosamine N-acyltransferase [Cyclobacteriaceae bacterium]|nr:UDP-3-O-(3-hydroxymyristoyl)glucosamine N-acyltransferase [Cyclobacteriaceae bacterium]MCB0498146.1 UDP-3-O-(3-hydroxymyristoyl)glucosamine N-acyltransferase [Cyclobacteriaceae bacterium]MCB9238870.1 UDP-3-O-(3-hydroxymyristoyl)glucosamine N-acyltransferase [Flammeovirgaceae bacterium]MCO5270589.1 UDP-3-O-(3-hydroxymyristoyl)glucosamine N-acyltransferase [Cyclobacteriaceae bacterium]MCW5900970.1 UDP-3-O-(3-hydroxymyristoyl)glucosamine N-acyltransferase [Cyclobacteriaceae bacterium]